MSEPYRDPARAPYITRDRSNNTMGWTLGALAAAAILGVVFYSMAGARTDRTPTAANPPAVTVAPAPAARVPAPPPEETTGQVAPPVR